MRKKFTEWYAKKYGFNRGPWWVELLSLFLWSPSIWYYTMATEECIDKWLPTLMIRINVYSVMNPDIEFDISVPIKYRDKVIKLIPKCGRAWYDYFPFELYGYGYAEPLCMALDKLGIKYILHKDISDNPDEEVQFV